MADPMRIRAVAKDGEVVVKVLMSHDMETGQRKDRSTGKPIPAHYIKHVSATWQGKVVLSAQWGTAVSKNPFLEFSFKGGKKGDKVQVTWTDNKGEKRTDEATIN
ncbi:MAG: thiosulfate oxidation carrier complex protein SoxZ [Burkholderiales bacterium]|nr:thiosulfate oxidation carrier complex protein SoxZ [Burkholderiales bacterium]